MQPASRQRQGEFRRDAMRQRARNTTSACFGEQFGCSAPVKRKRFRTGGWLANLGNTCASVCPAYWREVTATQLHVGMLKGNRTSSSPEYRTRG